MIQEEIANTDYDDLKIIKNKYGEKMMHLCRFLFPTILEKPGLLSKILLDNFEPSRSLCEDLDIYCKTEDFKDYIYMLADSQKKIDEESEEKTPEQLLSEAGYIFFECKTEEDIQKFKKYYAPDEELCTFKGGRLERCHVFFAVLRTVDSIRRKDFSDPERQDQYGTSVISIQFTKDASHTLSIKNRYNHRVLNPDATFSNDLDNIISGLTKSFEKHYKMEQKSKSKFELNGYVKVRDGKYYKYNYEINNIYYCPDNIIIDNFEVKAYPKERYILIDYFILNLQKKTLEMYDKEIRDCFPETICDIEEIIINKDGEHKKISIIIKDKKDITIILDKHNRIIKLFNNNLQKVGRGFLYENQALAELELPNLQEVEDFFLYNNQALTKLELPNLQKVGYKFLCANQALTKLELPNLQEVGYDFLCYNQALTKLELPNLQEVGDAFLYKNQALAELELPNLQKVGRGFLYENQALAELELPNLQEVGSGFLYKNQALSKKIDKFDRMR